jgi:hypothetical protein
MDGGLRQIEIRSRKVLKKRATAVALGPAGAFRKRQALVLEQPD